MKILLDECTPAILKKRLTDFEITTVQELNWAGIKNGELLARTELRFDVFITTDKNLRYQQSRRQTAGGRRQEAGRRKQAAGGRRQ